MDLALKKLGFQRPVLTSLVPAARRTELLQELETQKNRIRELEQEAASFADAREELKFLLDYYTMRAEKYEVLGGLCPVEKRCF